ncbi:Nre family DNA repair protein [Methanopyrus kandleri]|uniref:DNA repair protein n=2 Tax=Methanopyrus kandleri TaxID=2320 RepID=Q8TZ96_METKA|nr:Nre family DNA repair protein [Methanopyrus kandleri]AAM01257.1 Uncharacterized conserved protein [Methanopyrus kandleri AV19]HII70821.1 hypothetical protein [Methanopyrus kandleri]
MGGLCPRCRGRGWCGRDRCPFLDALNEVRARLSSRNVDGYTVTAHVSWRGYPRVIAAPGVGEHRTPDEGGVLADLPYEEALKTRALTFRRYRGKRDVRNPPDLSDPEIESSISVRPVESTLQVRRRLSGASRTTPFIGPLVEGELELDGTPKVPRDLERYHEDDVKAEEAVVGLYRRGYDESYIARALSLGLLGRDRRMVPTRWSVAAVDSMVSEHLAREVRDLPVSSEYRVLSGEVFGNEMWVILRPEPLSYELVEAYEPGAPWSDRTRIAVLRDSEVKDCKEPRETGGAYFAARLAALEWCSELGKQHGITVIRIVRKEYSAPLGAWVIREAVRRAEEVFSTDDPREVWEFLREKLDDPVGEAALKVIKRGRQRTLDTFL